MNELSPERTGSVCALCSEEMRTLVDRKCITCWVDEAEELSTKLRTYEEYDRARMSALLKTIGGTVDGQPTSKINYLQRLRQLVKAEANVQKAVEVLEKLLDGTTEGYVIVSEAHSLLPKLKGEK